MYHVPELPQGKILRKRVRTIRNSLGNRTFQIVSIWQTFHHHYRSPSFIQRFKCKRTIKNKSKPLHASYWPTNIISFWYQTNRGEQNGTDRLYIPKSSWVGNTPSEYDEKFVIASINAFINYLELIDNAIQIKAPYELIKKRAKNKGLLNADLNTQLTTKHSKHSASGQLKTHNQIQFHSKFANN